MLTLKLFSQKKHLYIHSIITTSAFTRFNPNRPLDLRLTELKTRGKRQSTTWSKKNKRRCTLCFNQGCNGFYRYITKSNATHVHYGNRIINRHVIAPDVACHACRGTFCLKCYLLASDRVRNSEAVTTLCTATSKHLAAVSGFHSFTETMLINSLSVRRLVCSFHRFIFLLVIFNFKFGVQK